MYFATQRHQNIQFVMEFKNQDAERASEKAINKTFELEILYKIDNCIVEKKTLARVLVGENKKNHQGLWQNVRTSLGKKNNVNIAPIAQAALKGTYCY
jgi:hypothetical protein